MKKCKTCAWYCHTISKCYGNAIQEELAVEVSPDDVCRWWTADGLTDGEREELDALATMERN